MAGIFHPVPPFLLRAYCWFILTLLGLVRF